MLVELVSIVVVGVVVLVELVVGVVVVVKNPVV
jgi:hypothetical protein